MESKKKCTVGEGALAAVTQKVSLKSKDHVKLNVGGRFFCTTIDTLTKNGETMLSAMFSGRMEIPVDAEGRVFIDRSGKHFDTILNFLRDGDAPLPKSETEIGELLAEAKYYCIANFVAVCEEYLSRLDRLDTPKVVRLCSHSEWCQLLETTSKPIVRLVVFPRPDVEILMHTNFFNQIALEWNAFFLFVYDAVTSNERFIWEFYNAKGQYIQSVDFIFSRVHTSCSEGEVYESLLRAMRICNNVFH